MTRGTLYYICLAKNEMMKVIRSCEFNGDMYPEGHGNDVMNALSNIDVGQPEEFKRFVKKFDKENFNYQAEKGGYFRFYDDKKVSFLISSRNENGITAIINGLAEFSFKRKSDNQLVTLDWFSSDWEFFKNGSPTTVYILTKDLQIVTLEPNDIAALPFMYLNGSWIIKGRN